MLRRLGLTIGYSNILNLGVKMEITRSYREDIMNLENAMKATPGVMLGDCCPLKHTFADGCYIREIFMPKGLLITSKIHKITHPYFILRGDVTVITEEGEQRITAPFSGITKAGTKRALYIHEDTTWVTVHVTKETEIDKIEQEIISPSFDDLEEVKCLG